MNWERNDALNNVYLKSYYNYKEFSFIPKTENYMKRFNVFLELCLAPNNFKKQTILILWLIDLKSYIIYKQHNRIVKK